ncbi:MAG: hypothetical protein LCI00_00185 [Chloroflexi bacterium]|nr:hypothetical protein [Chloroflexota bacterium]MCC6894355.1 hypothetical protein [Anaerolineae bacterium]
MTNLKNFPQFWYRAPVHPPLKPIVAFAEFAEFAVLAFRSRTSAVKNHVVTTASTASTATTAIFSTFQTFMAFQRAVVVAAIDDFAVKSVIKKLCVSVVNRLLSLSVDWRLIAED